MPGAGRNRLPHRTMLVVAAASLFLLVGLAAIVLVNGPTSLPATNVSVDCVAPSGPTARGYGESGAAGAAGDPACDPKACDPKSAGSATARGYGESGAGGVTAAPDCDPRCEPKSAGGATARGYGESGAGGVTAVPSCDPCPPGSSPGGATGRGYGESGASGVMPKDATCTPSKGDEGTAGGAAAPAGGGDGPTRKGDAKPAPMTGGGGAHEGRVPGAMGRAAPTPTTAADATRPLDAPVASSVVANAPGPEGARKNTALVVGGLVLLLVAVGVVLRRGRPGFAR